MNIKVSSAILFAGLCTLLLPISSCNNQKASEEAKSFEVVYPRIADTVEISEFVTQIYAIQNTEIRTRTKGFIESVKVDEGQAVKEGQTLFMINNKVYQQQLLKAQAITKSAKAELTAAEIELENSKKLLDKNIISKTEYQLAIAKLEGLKAQYEQALAEESEASLRVSFTDIKAPFDGVINRIPKKMGSLIEEGELLTTISNNKEVFCYFNISEKEYLDFILSRDTNSNQKVLLRLANGEMFDQTGVIETSESEFDPNTGNIAFRARFANPHGILKHGSNGKILIQHTIKNAMLIPQKSTFEIQDKVYVYVVKDDNTLEQRNIEIGERYPHFFTVISGLNADEKILYEGLDIVNNGTKINPILKENK